MNFNLLPIIEIAELVNKLPSQIEGKYQFLKEFLFQKKIIKNESDMKDSLLKDLLKSSTIKKYTQNEEIYTYSKEIINNNHIKFKEDQEIDYDSLDYIDIFILINGTVGVYEGRDNEEDSREFEILSRNSDENGNFIKEIEKEEVFGSLNRICRIVNLITNDNNDLGLKIENISNIENSQVERLDSSIIIVNNRKNYRNSIMDNELNMNKHALISDFIKIVSLKNNTKILEMHIKKNEILIQANNQSIIKKEKENEEINESISNSLNQYKKINTSKTKKKENSSVTEFYSNNITDCLNPDHIFNKYKEILNKGLNRKEVYRNLEEMFIINQHQHFKNIKPSTYASIVTIKSILSKENQFLYKDLPYQDVINDILNINSSSFNSDSDRKELLSFYFINFLYRTINKLHENIQIHKRGLYERLLMKHVSNPNFFGRGLKEGVESDDFKVFFLKSFFKNKENKGNDRQEYDEKKKIRKDNEELINSNRKRIKEEDSLFEKTVYCLKCQIHPRNVVGNCNHLLYCDDCMKIVSACGTCGASMIEFIRLFRS